MADSNPEALHDGVTKRAAPFALLVKGPPGAGKSSLSRALADLLWLPRISRDVVREGMYRTLEQGAPGHGDYAPTYDVFQAFYEIIELHLDRGCSVVVDATWQLGRSEPEIAARLVPRARLLQVFCTTPDPISRVMARAKATGRWGVANDEEFLAQHREYVEVRTKQSDRPLGLGCPTLIVDTSDGYKPPLVDIAGWALGALDRGRYNLGRLPVLDPPAL